MSFSKLEISLGCTCLLLIGVLVFVEVQSTKTNPVPVKPSMQLGDVQSAARIKWVNDCMKTGARATPPKNEVEAMLRDDSSLVKECTDAALRLMPRGSS